MRELAGGGFLSDTGQPSKNWLTRYIPSEDQDQVQAHLLKAIDTKATFDLEHRVLRLDRTVGWTHSRAIPLLDESGNIIEWFGSASDITRRKHLEGHQQVLVAELQHRTRNLLAVVRNVARRSFPASLERDEYDARLGALGRVQGFLSRAPNYSVPLADVVEADCMLLATAHPIRSRLPVPLRSYRARVCRRWPSCCTNSRPMQSNTAPLGRLRVGSRSSGASKWRKTTCDVWSSIGAAAGSQCPMAHPRTRAMAQN